MEQTKTRRAAFRLKAFVHKLARAYYFAFGGIAAVFIIGALLPRLLHMIYSSGPQFRGIGADTIVDLGWMTADQLGFAFAGGFCTAWGVLVDRMADRRLRWT